ncbi:LysR family transcriptional regulator [Rhizobium sp. RU36D]|uniref:LysR family transcriptional regulator n=1 Tax=Rhizobium sp. RU36D TaxID=1907415 RepID=UPI0009D8CB0D|nr:LysR family transcriptional regulator [Rhizobium sp. RU36D]SMC99803.1 DNA-binding transcriptional regulator, LysR family [Rhizobium sp. RU36D]
MQKTIDWDLLRSFLAVARAGKLTTAARRLKINHATLSRRISALEGALGVKLFDRDVAGYRLTPQGERLVARAEDMETSVFGAQTSIAEESAAVSGTVRIGSPDGFGTAFLAPRIGALCQMHPELDIDLVAMPRSFNLSKREADIAIGLSQPQAERLQGRKLTDYELGVYGAAARAADWQDLKTSDDLARHPFISYIDDLIFAPELDYIPSISRSIAPRLRSSSVVAQMQATASGLGLCVLPCFLAEGDRRLMRILPREVRLIRSFWITVHADTRSMPRIAATADFIARLVRDAESLFLPPQP